VTTDQTSHPPRRRRPSRRLVVWTTAGLLLFLGLAQLVPFGRSTSNPPVTQAAKFPDATTQQLFADACGDCHSNLTKRWWLTRIAPGSWLAENDVRGGRRILDVSEWNRGQADAEEVVRAVESGSMPPIQYKLFHGNSRLSDAQRAQLAEGLRRLYAADAPPIYQGRRD
jgi:mono/diheme cytochrome c family protein